MPVSKGRPRERQTQKPPPNHPPTKDSNKLCRALLQSFLKILGTIGGGIWGTVRPYLRPRKFCRFLILLLTIAASGLFFLPRVTVEPSDAYDPAHPSPVTFTISNTNIVPLRNVDVGIGVCYTSFKEFHSADCDGPTGSELIFVPWSVHWLDVDEKYQIAIEDALKVAPPEEPTKQLESADISIVVHYTPWRMPSLWRNKKEFRFITKKRSDGKIYWVPTPLNRRGWR